MPNTKLPPLHEEYSKFIGKPFGGLFGPTAQQKVLEELMADPHSSYRIADLARILGIDRHTVKPALLTLNGFGLVTIEHGESRHSDYKVNKNSKILFALEILSYAISDTIESTSVMEDMIEDYYNEIKWRRTRDAYGYQYQMVIDRSTPLRESVMSDIGGQSQNNIIRTEIA